MFNENILHKLSVPVHNINSVTAQLEEATLVAEGPQHRNTRQRLGEQHEHRRLANRLQALDLAGHIDELARHVIVVPQQRQ